MTQTFWALVQITQQRGTFRSVCIPVGDRQGREADDAAARVPCRLELPERAVDTANLTYRKCLSNRTKMILTIHSQQHSPNVES